MKIGVTGTRNNINDWQKEAVTALLADFKIQGYTEFHHGDCIGADIQSAEIAKVLGFKIVCHPPIKNELRGHFKSDEYRYSKTYFKRNRAIVNECDDLLVIPMHTEWQPQGGTWYTYDYAKKQSIPRHIIYPDKRYEEEK